METTVTKEVRQFLSHLQRLRWESPWRKLMKRLMLLICACMFALICAACSQLPEPAEAAVPEPALSAVPEDSASADAEPSETPAPDAVPSASSHPSAVPTPELLLRLGSLGPKVADAKARLISLFYLPASSDSQYFDEETRQAVKAFQEAAGLETTGMIDAAVMAALFSPEAPLSPHPAAPPATETPAPTPEPLPLTGVRIGLDPGHQARGSSVREPVAPGSSVTKARVSSGTAGIASGVDEHVVNLSVGLKLRELLQALGAEVVMTRESADVDISNRERALLFNDAQVDLAIRLHCDGEDDTARHGAFVLIPAGSYTKDIQSASRAAAQSVLDAFCAVTGAKNLGLSERDDQTGFNWSTVPVITIEMGHMSNREEDLRLADEGYQGLCAQGIAEGIRRYFGV